MSIDTGISSYVNLELSELKLGTGKFLIDTGAEVTLVKINALQGDTFIYEDQKIKLRGIDKDAMPTETLGYTHLTFFIGGKRVIHTLSVVPVSFPIEYEGVIGSDFLQSMNAIIDYQDGKIELLGYRTNLYYDKKCLNRAMPDLADENISNYELCESQSNEVQCEKVEVNKKSFKERKNFINENNINNDERENMNDKIYGKENYISNGETERNEEGYVIIEPRCEKVISVNIVGPEISEGIITESKMLAEGVYVCPSIVKVKDSKALTVCLNTTNKEIKLRNVQVEVEPLNIKNEMDEIMNINTINSEGKFESSRLNKLEQTLKTDHLNKEERKSLIDLCKEYNHIFHLEGDKLTATDTVMHEIPIKESTPINTKSYRYPEALKEEVNNQIEKLLKDEIIKPSSSPWNSPVWIVPKKTDAPGRKKWRLVIDFRKLNEISIGDVYPLPQINDILDQLGHSKYFTTLDLASGFHQIRMHPDDQAKTAFSVPLGHYEFTRMPFGLKNAPATFQRLMNNVLTGIQGIKCFVYLDDIVNFGSSLEDHNLKLKEVFDRFSLHNLKLQPDKCEFLKTEVMYLGHLIE